MFIAKHVNLFSLTAEGLFLFMLLLQQVVEVILYCNVLASFKITETMHMSELVRTHCIPQAPSCLKFKFHPLTH